MTVDGIEWDKGRLCVCALSSPKRLDWTALHRPRGEGASSHGPHTIDAKKKEKTHRYKCHLA